MRGAHGRTRRGPRGSVCGGLRLPRVFVCLTASHRPTERARGRESRRAAGEGAAARPRGRGSGPSRPVFDTRLLPGSGGRRREGAQQTCSWPGLRCAPAPSVILGPRGSRQPGASWHKATLLMLRTPRSLCILLSERIGGLVGFRKTEVLSWK